MGKIILENAVKRKPGFLYYVDGNGNVCETAMAHGRKKKSDSKKKTVKKITTKPAKKVTKKVTKKVIKVTPTK